ncbi:hypothetical protein K438DRAFT_1844944 [Mycena galopus ATCC 62051]|nr:hypothetical protein K438DRAFT_1844944 [Mycena galopus ATCC 62051]
MALAGKVRSCLMVASEISHPGMELHSPSSSLTRLFCKYFDHLTPRTCPGFWFSSLLFTQLLNTSIGHLG